ncbi:MAG TPA: hypothetical protein VLA19_31555, partial [Herpetosiphonaceae bacterium]|nr:hypothetical protein [Herpetosiphonaceae bacterium]
SMKTARTIKYWSADHVVPATLGLHDPGRCPPQPAAVHGSIRVSVSNPWTALLDVNRHAREYVTYVPGSMRSHSSSIMRSISSHTAASDGCAFSMATSAAPLV